MRFTPSASSFLRALPAVMLALALVLAPGLAEARLGGGSSFGSRGFRSFSMPQATPTAPRVAPFGRSMTQPSPGYRQTPGTGYGGRMFGGGFGRGFMGGLLGAGLLGLLFGGGFFGGMGGFGSLIGLLIQLALVWFVVKWALSRFAGRPAGYASQGSTSAYGGAAGFGAAGSPLPGAAPQTRPLQLAAADFDAFEQRLVEAQAAYSAEDLDRLRRFSTPEMASYFAEQIADNARRGLHNEVRDVRLVKGDLSEAWSEPGADYATVAMRFSLIDATYERASRRLVEGDAQNPVEVTEVWTYRRMPGAGPQGWLISGIQQA